MLKTEFQNIELYDEQSKASVDIKFLPTAVIGFSINLTYSELGVVWSALREYERQCQDELKRDNLSEWEIHTKSYDYTISKEIATKVNLARARGWDLQNKFNEYNEKNK